jgi:hypothetical protein
MLPSIFAVLEWQNKPEGCVVSCVSATANTIYASTVSVSVSMVSTCIGTIAKSWDADMWSLARHHDNRSYTRSSPFWGYHRRVWLSVNSDSPEPLVNAGRCGTRTLIEKRVCRVSVCHIATLALRPNGLPSVLARGETMMRSYAALAWALATEVTAAGENVVEGDPDGKANQ